MLSSTEIKDLLNKDIILEPYSDGALNASGYDAACSFDVVLPPLSWGLASTSEKITLSNSISACIFIRSSLAREGIFGSFALIDPGFSGNLTISLFNASDKEVTLHRGERVVQISFFKLLKPTDRPYSGKYQNSKGVVKSKRGETLEGSLPRRKKAYERSRRSKNYKKN
ncbi:MAG: dCTP deaminase [Thermoprotei archaeon]